MKTRTKILSLCALVAGLGLLYGAWAAWRAHRNLVTLNVRNMDVRRVVKKIEWQTWKSISVDKNVQGKVTLNVRKAPLEEVLRIVGAQTSSEWSALYPLYTSGRSLAWLKRALCGEVDPAQHGWTNLRNQPLFRGGPMFGGGPFGGPNGNQNQLVSLQIYNKDVPFVMLAFSRFTQARVVPEDGTTATINLTLKQATLSAAVAQLAKKAHRSWTKLYVLRGQFGPGGPGGPRGPGGPPQFAARDTNSPADFGGPGGPPPFARGPGGPDGPGGPPQFGAFDTNSPDARGFRGPNLTQEQRVEMRQQRETLEEELNQTLPAADRQRLEEAQQQREQQRQEMQNLPPEQRAQRMGQMAGGGFDQMNRDRVRNTTPEQRSEMTQRMRQMRQNMQQQPPAPAR